MRVPGASQFLGAATLANGRGVPPSTPTVLSQGESTASLLDQGRRALRISGIGISNRSRALNAQYLSQSTSLGNQILSLAAGTDSTVEGVQQQILALRARLPESALARDLRGTKVNKEV